MSSDGSLFFHEDDQQVSPWTLTSWMLCFIVNAAGQPTGKIMGRQLYGEVDLRRCFPFAYAFDAATNVLVWLILTLGNNNKGFREAASIILEDGLISSAASDDAPARAIRTLKDGTWGRSIAFLIGVLPSLIKLSACRGVAALQVLAYLWVGPWVVFEILVFAATFRIPSTPVQSASPAQDLHVMAPWVEKIHRYSTALSITLNTVTIAIPPITFALTSWHKLAASWPTGPSRLEGLVFGAALVMVLIYFSWFLVILMPLQWVQSILWGRLKKAIIVGGAVLLAGIWIPLVITFKESLKVLSIDVGFCILVGGVIIGILLFSFFQETVPKTSMVTLNNLSGGITSLLLHDFVNYSNKEVYGPQWKDVLG